jgi:hypothetical protein
MNMSLTVTAEYGQQKKRGGRGLESADVTTSAGWGGWWCGGVVVWWREKWRGGANAWNGVSFWGIVGVSIKTFAGGML